MRYGCLLQMCLACSIEIKKIITNANEFPKFLGESWGKPNKILADQSSDLYNRSMKAKLLWC